jgi:hypothetical protein
VRIKIYNMILACTLLLAGCDEPAAISYPQELQALKNRLATVNMDDGISKDEADIIAENYWALCGIGCGAMMPPEDWGQYWISKTVLGYAARPTREPIRIDKKSGQITWSDGPTIKNPKTMWDKRF